MAEKRRTPLDERRVNHLLELLRKRTPEEIGIAMIFAPAFTPEMWRALELLRLERSTQLENQAP